MLLIIIDKQHNYPPSVIFGYSRDQRNDQLQQGSLEDSLAYIAAWQTGMFQPADMMEYFGAKSEGRETRFDDLGPLRRGL